MNDNMVNEILARLQNGENIDAIASEFTESLNKANQEHMRLQEESKRKKEQDELHEEKVEAVLALINAFIDLLAAYEVDSEILDELEDIDAEDVVKTIDEALPFIEKYIELVDMLPKAESKKEERPAEKPDRCSSGDAIERFLNDFVRGL